MARLSERIETASAALSTLEEALREPFSKLVRDAAIQRFEYTHETVWKAAQAYLAEREGERQNTPKAAFRACFRAGLIDEEQGRLAVEMVDDRNRTSHTYKEAIAQRIFERLPAYAALMRELLGRFAQRQS